MNNLNLNLKLYFKKRKQRLSVFGISPKIDWWFILVLAGIIFVTGVVYAIYLYNTINNNTFFEIIENTAFKNEIDYKKSQIKNTIDLLQKQNFDESIIN